MPGSGIGAFQAHHSTTEFNVLRAQYRGYPNAQIFFFRALENKCYHGLYFLGFCCTNVFGGRLLKNKCSCFFCSQKKVLYPTIWAGTNNDQMQRRLRCSDRTVAKK